MSDCNRVTSLRFILVHIVKIVPLAYCNYAHMRIEYSREVIKNMQDSKDRINLLLGENLIKKVKTKSIEADISVSEFCRVILNAWQSGIFNLDSYDNRDNFPEQSGIYFAIWDNKIFYIGQSKNIKTRFKGHHHDSSFQKNSATIAWFAVPEIALKEIEGFCIKLIEPELNNHHLKKHGIARENYIPTRLSDDEKLALDALAKNEGITSLSEMIRHLIRSEAKRLGLWKVKDNDHK